MIETQTIDEALLATELLLAGWTESAVIDYLRNLREAD